nr:tetratricopeptide repeat protein [Lachnospiraceae bacterium]
WVISKNMRPEKNIADDYITELQGDPAKLSTLNQAAKKYNYAYAQCCQGILDIPDIQLRKVISLNPKYVQAYLLLALIYITTEEWNKASKILKKCLSIDKNNTTALRYKKIVDDMTNSTEAVKTGGDKNKGESVRYTSDNDVIIQPTGVREPGSSPFSTIINVIIGLIIGIGVAYFLLVPRAKEKERTLMQQSINEMAAVSDEKTLRIQELEGESKNMQTKMEKVEGELEEEKEALKRADSIMDVASGFISSEDKTALAEQLDAAVDGGDIESMSDSYKNLYKTVLAQIGPGLSKEYYDLAYEAYRRGEYSDAIAQFEKALRYDEENPDIMLYLGSSYMKDEQIDQAREMFEKIMEKFPDTDRARRAEQYLEELGANEE